MKSPPDETRRLIHRLERFAYDNFNAQYGPSIHYFDLPQIRRDSVRVVYTAYGVKGKTFTAVEKWMFDKILRPLLRKGGKHLFWRLSGMFEVDHKDGFVYLYTRIAVLDSSLAALEIDEYVRSVDSPYDEAILDRS